MANKKREMKVREKKERQEMQHPGRERGRDVSEIAKTQRTVREMCAFHKMQIVLHLKKSFPKIPLEC